MNIGLYQSASALSALERWQDSVSQNITSSQTTGYRKRTVNFSTQLAGEVRPDARARVGRENGVPLVFPKVNTGINFTTGETQPTRGEFDVAIQGEGFFEIEMGDGEKAYTRSGEFRLRPDRTIVTSGGNPVLTDAGAVLQLLPTSDPVTINGDGSVFQGATAIGKLSIKTFADTSRLIPLAGGYFIPGPDLEAETLDEPVIMQGYLEGSNVSPLREMVDLVLISRAYEANQKIITTVDQQMEKTLNALG